MSERETNKVLAAVMITMLGVVWTLSAYLAGKRVADVWYAAHPVVKEVPTVPTINGVASFIVKPGQMCAFVTFDKGLHYESSCERDPDAPKPQKGSKRHAIQMDRDGGFSGMDAAAAYGHTVWSENCDPIPGIACYSCQPYGATCSVPSAEEIELYRKRAQPIPEKEPAPIPVEKWRTQFKTENDKVYTRQADDQPWVEMASGSDPCYCMSHPCGPEVVPAPQPSEKP